ncbi:alcohol oxidase-like protein [Biscogniauxia mediterranea]|nr:alcohol oxidase-like protein [Biscogniauxia mediterranea]
MGIYTTLPENIQEVDVIIAGGGTTGCVIASRLADADPELSVLLIEHGPNNHGNPLVSNPLLWRAHLQPGSGTNMYYLGKNESQLADRGIAVAAGGILGGGSSINFSIYARAQGADYDAWNVKGWSADDLRPFMNKAEKYYGDGDKEDHGLDGPVQISSGSYRHSETERSFISAMDRVGYPEIRDLQNLHANNGVSHSLKYVSIDGKRQDAAHAYLHPRLQDGKHENLHVLVESQVIRVIFDKEKKRAIGVEYRANPAFQNHVEQHGTREVKARKLVVLSCGTLGNPGILERSGVGDPKVLENAGVPIVADVPGVGRGYQDHQVIPYHYKSSIPRDETSDVAFLDPPASVGNLIASGDKILGWNGFDASGKLRPTESEVDALGHEFRKVWDRDYKNIPSKPLAAIMMLSGYFGDPSQAPPGSYTCLGVYNAYPYSRGHVHITGPHPDDPLDFETGFLADDDETDLKIHLWAYKKQREAARRMSVYRGELGGRHGPRFAPGSRAAVAEPVAAAGSRIEYGADDDAAIAAWVRGHVTTCWHGLGTCKMAPREQGEGEGGGVVDEKLDVYGVRGLKVADLSIAPRNVAANTNNTALTIGEKAADIIVRELKGLLARG